ncbi:MAG: type II toxin-antitoxin system RelE/ParE family toxin [Terracidiphilus sp.]
MFSAVRNRLAVYLTKPFARFARKARIREVELWETARLANAGAIDADLGGGVIKQRIARAGEGKSGGARAIFSSGSRGAQYSYLGLRRRTWAISRRMNWKHSRSWRT